MKMCIYQMSKSFCVWYVIGDEILLNKVTNPLITVIVNIDNLVKYQLCCSKPLVGHVQEVCPDNGPITVFIEALGGMHTTAVKNVKPFETYSGKFSESL